MSDNIKTIDQLCARDLGRRVRYATRDGEAAEGHLRLVVQSIVGKNRFSFMDRHGTFEIWVGQFRLGGLSGKKEIEFL